MNQRIKEVRLHLGLNQSEFGERLAVTGAAISRIEAGNREASNQVVLAICREFNVREQWLRTGEGEMFVPQKREDEVAQFFGQLIKVDSDDLRFRIVHALAKLNADDWERLDVLLKKLLEDYKQ